MLKMDMSISGENVILFAVVLAFATSASADPAENDALCYDDIRYYKDVGYSGVPKPIHIDIKRLDPIPAGGQFTMDFTGSKVPSGQMSTPAPIMHPDFKLTSSTAHTFSYTAPNRPADFHGKVVVSDTYCGFTEEITHLTLPVR